MPMSLKQKLEIEGIKSSKISFGNKNDDKKKTGTHGIRSLPAVINKLELVNV